METGDYKPMFYKYSFLQKRLETYKLWPQHHHVKAVALAQAGFFYTDCSDYVRCFYCGVILGDWVPGDSVWSEHATHSPECAFVKMFCFTGAASLPPQIIRPCFFMRGERPSFANRREQPYGDTNTGKVKKSNCKCKNCA